MLRLARHLDLVSLPYLITPFARLSIIDLEDLRTLQILALSALASSTIILVLTVGVFVNHGRAELVLWSREALVGREGRCAEKLAHIDVLHSLTFETIFLLQQR